MEIPTPIFCNLARYPVHRFRANQWGEAGWVYDPRDRLYYRYEIDRKDQHDRVDEIRTREQFEAIVMPRTSDAVRAWFRGFECLRADNAEYVFWRESGALKRYALGPGGGRLDAGLGLSRGSRS